MVLDLPDETSGIEVDGTCLARRPSSDLDFQRYSQSDCVRLARRDHEYYCWSAKYNKEKSTTYKLQAASPNGQLPFRAKCLQSVVFRATNADGSLGGMDILSLIG
jgi:hypothetical protein